MQSALGTAIRAPSRHAGWAQWCRIEALTCWRLRRRKGQAPAGGRAAAARASTATMARAQLGLVMMGAGCLRPGAHVGGGWSGRVRICLFPRPPSRPATQAANSGTPRLPPASDAGCGGREEAHWGWPLPEPPAPGLIGAPRSPASQAGRTVDAMRGRRGRAWLICPSIASGAAWLAPAPQKPPTISSDWRSVMHQLS